MLTIKTNTRKEIWTDDLALGVVSTPIEPMVFVDANGKALDMLTAPKLGLTATLRKSLAQALFAA